MLSCSTATTAAADRHTKTKKATWTCTHTYGLALQSSLSTSEDSTQYGTARTSPSSFLAHHLASISAAVVYADAQELCTAGKATSDGLTIGLAP